MENLFYVDILTRIVRYVDDVRVLLYVSRLLSRLAKETPDYVFWHKRLAPTYHNICVTDGGSVKLLRAFTRPEEWTLLTGHKHMEIVQHILDCGIGINWQSSAPLEAPAATGRVDIFMQYINGGIPVADGDRNFALETAALHTHTTIVGIILKLDTELTSQRPLSLRNALTVAAKASEPDTLVLLLDYCRANAFTYDVQQVLHSATAMGHTGTIKAILDVMTTEQRGASTAIVCACARGNVEVAQLLFEHGLDPRVGNDNALLVACRNGHLETARWAIERGCNVNTNPGVIEVVCRSTDKIELLRLLVDNGADVSANHMLLRYAVGSGQYRYVEMLIECGADVHDEHILGLAVKCPTIVDLLLRNGACARTHGYIALTQAVKCGNTRSMSYIIAAGARLTAHQKGDLIAMAAAYHGQDSRKHIEIIKLLAGI